MSFFKNRNYKKSTETKSTARIVNPKIVEVTAEDGEKFEIISNIGRYPNEETRNYQLHRIEELFDRHFSDDKEMMIDAIWREAMKTGINILGISPGNRQGERMRIGNRIRQIREERGIEARDLAELAGIDAANLSRIENGRYSVGLDILSRIAATLGNKIDLVEL